MARTEAEMNRNTKMNRNTNKNRAHSMGRQRHFRASLKLLLTLGLLSVSSLMAGNKLSMDLQGLPPSASVDVIIQFTGLPSQADLDAVSHAGGVMRQALQSIHGALFTVKVGQLNGIANNPHITYISPDRKISS